MIKAFLSERLERLKQIRDCPHAVAGGVAIGVFWGFTPLVGFKTLLSMLIAWICRCSKLSAVIAVTLHDVLIPVWPVIFRWEYEIGYWLLSHPHRFPERLQMVHLRFAHWLHLKTLKLLWPTFIGAVIIGVPASVLSYWIIVRVLQRYEATKHRHLTSPP